MVDRAAYSLLELNQYIRRVLTLNFDQPIWIECEIGQASFSRGHWYLDLIQKEGESIVAQCQAAMWAKNAFLIRRKSSVPPEDILRQGMSVKLRINVDYHERYGLKLIIDDIDTTFTIGQLELQRQAILKTLKERDLIRKNAGVPLPVVVQRLAVISSDRAAGWKDFVKHIDDNVYGYDIAIDLYESAMQGLQVEAEVLTCLDMIEKKMHQYDAVAIVRGGGGRTDLAAFDNLALAFRIAEYPLPVLIGIGHEIDQSVLDLVAFRSLKTPTAVAEFVINHNAVFEGRLAELNLWIKDETFDLVQLQKEKLHDLENRVKHAIESRMRLEENRLSNITRLLGHGGKQLIRAQDKRLEFIEQLLAAVDPDKVLMRGYTITVSNGKAIQSSRQIEQGMSLNTIFHDGQIKSIVE